MAISTDLEDNKEGQEQNQDQVAAFSWRLDSLNLYSRESQWLQSSLSDLEKKKEAMLKIMQDDGDSFVKRVDMYYKKRPELVDMVDDLCKSYRYLAENYDKLRSESLRSSSTNSFTRQHTHKNIVEDRQWTEMELEMSKLVGDSVREQAELIRRNNEKRQVIKEFQYEINRLMDENKDLKSRLVVNCEVDDGKKKQNPTRASRFRNTFCMWLSG